MSCLYHQQAPLALHDSLAPSVLCQWLLLYNHPQLLSLCLGS
jgi:hypothetical protein